MEEVLPGWGAAGRAAGEARELVVLGGLELEVVFRDELFKTIFALVDFPLLLINCSLPLPLF